ncbi:MAG TPA: fused MFS/spermidine synthase, partial [Isosphaeraceae bacterium]|nr:fused MFS/spermidine synthase [Isosphaeraceae bacterium]
MSGFAARLLPYALAFTSSLCIMILELVSSRLVARHVGQSLTVWTSVIGIILAGICLGNVLGGRLADRVEPRRAVGPLFALGSLLTLSALWINAEIGHILPNPDQINWELRTIIVIVLDFLVPATVLGMVGPVVAKMAVEQARKAGSAIGDVYFWGAMGSIAGTFLCGFVLMNLAPTSTIVVLVAAALALLAAALIGEPLGLAAGIAAALLLGLGSVTPLVSRLNLGAIDLGSYKLNYLAVAGTFAGLILGILGAVGLFRARSDDQALTAAVAAKSPGGEFGLDKPRPKLTDLAVLAFAASMAFMALEMVAGRLVQRHLGSS